MSEADGSTVIYLPQPLRDPAPDACNFSRFLRVVVELEEERGMIAAMIRTMREQLMEEADDFGEFLGYDGKAMESHSTGARNRVTGKTSDADADWGKHETHGIHAKTGKPWKKIKSWFGYRVHTIADTQYEIPVAASVTRASVSEVKELERLSERLFEETPALAERCKEFSADRGLDSGPLKATLWDRHRIRPLIDSRALWSAEKKQAGYDPTKPISRPLFRDRNGLHSPYRERGGDLQVPGHRNRALDGVPGVRGRPLDSQVPLPGRRLWLRMRGTGRLPQRRRLQGGRVRSGGPHRPGESTAAASSPRLRTAARPGGADPIAGARWSASTAASTMASGSSATPFAARRR